MTEAVTKQTQQNENQQQSQQHNPAEQVREQGLAFESPQSEKLSQFQSMADASPRQEKNRVFKNQIENSPQTVAQKKRAAGGVGLIHHSKGKVQQHESKEPVDHEQELNIEEEALTEGQDLREEPTQLKKDAHKGTRPEQPLQKTNKPINTAHENIKPTQLKETSQPKANNTGLPDSLKTGIENLSGMSMDDVKVHYNSNKPAQLHAHAYAQGADIHLCAGQEKHLPHEAWHVVQQKQGRVKPTVQMKGGVNVNDEEGLEREADVMGEQALSVGYRDNSAYLTRDLETRESSKDTIAQPIQAMRDLKSFVPWLLKNKRVNRSTDYELDCILYWNTRNEFDGLSGQDLEDKVLEFRSQGFEGEVDEKARSAGQSDSKLELPEFMLGHYEFDFPLPLDIGILSFRHGHQYVMGVNTRSWISNNITWRDSSTKKIFSIHVIIEFSGEKGSWDANPHVTIRLIEQQLKATGAAMISDEKERKREAKEMPKMELTRTSYSIGLGKSSRKPGEAIKASFPTDFVPEVFVPWLKKLKGAVALNAVQPDSIDNRRLWLSRYEMLRLELHEEFLRHKMDKHTRDQ